MTRTIVAGALAGVLAISNVAMAQDWPTRPVTVVVPFAAGGANDVMVRLLVPTMSETLGQQVVVENVSGAGGTTGSSRVAKAAPDGYTFVMASAATHAYSQTIYKKPPYDAAADFAPVALIAEQPLVLVTRKDLPASNLKEFIAYTKANQSKMQYGSAGTGSATHLGCILFNQKAGLDVTHVPYRGGAPLVQDLIAGRIDYWCGLTSTAIPQIKGGTIKAIAMLSRERLPVMADLPTAHEQGLADFEANNWGAFFYPKGTPAEIVNKLNAATVKAMQDPNVEARLRQLGATIVAPPRRSPDYLAKFTRDEIAKWAVPIKASGFTQD
jgi:tripartite-type tricarboxylate transporter receptor subunit TctC